MDSIRKNYTTSSFGFIFETIVTLIILFSGAYYTQNFGIGMLACLAFKGLYYKMPNISINYKLSINKTE